MDAAIGDHGLPFVPLAAYPPDFVVAPGSHLLRREFSVFGRVPLTSNTRMQSLERHLGCYAASRAIWATMATSTSVEGCLPLMTFVAPPPYLLGAAGTHRFWLQVSVPGWVPLASDLWVQRFERRLRRSAASRAIWATMAPNDTGVDGGLPFMSFVAHPPDLIAAARMYLLRRKLSVVAWMPLASDFWIQFPK